MMSTQPVATQFLTPKRTKYKRLVNNIYPRNISDGLERNEMAKLTFYVMSEPQKLDRVFEYLSKKTLQSMRRRRERKRVQLSLIAMKEIMDVSNTQIALYVRIYLETIEKLISEDIYNDIELLNWALASFDYFCNIKEDTVKYERNYDKFVDKFGSFAHFECKDNPNKESHIRVAGLRGLQAIVRKLANDDLHSELWFHMNKIIPSLIFNIDEARRKSTGRKAAVNAAVKSIVFTQFNDTKSDGTIDHPSSSSPTTDKTPDTPVSLAEVVLEDIFRRSQDKLHFMDCIAPLLSSLDNKMSWRDQSFCQALFDSIIQAMNGSIHQLISAVLAHVEGHLTDDTKTDVLRIANYCISKNGSNSEFIGSHLYSNLKRLLSYLRSSLEIMVRDETNWTEKAFVDTVLETMRDLATFSKTSHNVQTMESVMYILDNLETSPVYEVDMKLQQILIQTIKAILSSMNGLRSDMPLPSPSVFKPLFSLMNCKHTSLTSRHAAIEILTDMLDRGQNLSTLRHSIANGTLDNKMVCSRSQCTAIRIMDSEFMSRYGDLFIGAIDIPVFDAASQRELSILNSLILLIAVFYIEYSRVEHVFEKLVTMCLSIQDEAVSGDFQYPTNMTVNLFVGIVMSVLAKLSQSNVLSPHVIDVMDTRQRMLPNVAWSGFPIELNAPATDDEYREQWSSTLLFNRTILSAIIYEQPRRDIESSMIKMINRESEQPSSAAAVKSAAADQSDDNSKLFRADSTQNIVTVEEMLEAMRSSPNATLLAIEKEDQRILDMWSAVADKQNLSEARKTLDESMRKQDERMSRLKMILDSCVEDPSKHPRPLAKTFAL